MKKILFILILFSIFFLNGCLGDCSEGQKTFEEKLLKLGAALNSSYVNTSTRYSYCVDTLEALDASKDCYSDYTESREILAKKCEDLQLCSESQKGYEEKIMKLEVTTNSSYLNMSTIYSYCIDALESLDASDKDCYSDYTESREILAKKCEEIQSCIPYEQAIKEVAKTHTSMETNTILMKESCDNLISMIKNGKDCDLDNTTLKDKVINSARTYCGYEDQTNICNGFNNADFEESLSAWSPYIEVNGQGRIVDSNYQDFSLEIDNQTNSTYLKIQNSYDPNERSSISQRLTLNLNELKKYSVSFRIKNNNDLTYENALLYSRITFLDQELETIANYFWFYSSEQTIMNLFGGPFVYENFGLNKDAEWRTVSINLADAVDQVVPFEKRNQIKGIRFSSGIYNFGNSSVSMFLDDINIKCN
ncbi:MAG TPA: hypothetical protein VI912_01925 [Candidatus Bilamarchaeaceae archaeon]|nr:hypothetical protein [Candidatus Bilamarchaeaceae archaeon]